jgi:hypothetical protein
MDRDRLIERITTNPEIFSGKPIIRGQRLAVEHVLEMLDAGGRSRRHLGRVRLAPTGRYRSVSGILGEASHVTLKRS